jgi:hypothetical protein
VFSGQMAEVGRLAAQEDAVMTLSPTKPGERLCDGYATHDDLASYALRDSQVLPSNVLDARIRGQSTAALKIGGWRMTTNAWLDRKDIRSQHEAIPSWGLLGRLADFYGLHPA